MRILKVFMILILLLFVFQNCGSFKAANENRIYTYSSAPDFYHDIKLVLLEVDELGRQQYSFDLAVSYAHDPSQAISYQVSFSTIKISSVCQVAEGTANGESKHFRVNCLLPVPDELYVQLVLVGPQEERVTRQYRY